MSKRLSHPVIVVLLLAAGIGLASWAIASSYPGTLADIDSVEPAVEQQVEWFGTEISAGPDIPRVDLGRTSPDGEPLTASCTTCHTTRQPNYATASASELDVFHQGLTYQHGSLACLSCHNGDNYDALRLANSVSVSFPDVMTLCSQCHGPQRRDYDHGAHGGMSGYWDLSRGPRVRNNCVDCHDPHSPAFPMMQPTFKPKDRFLDPHTHGMDQLHE